MLNSHILKYILQLLNITEARICLYVCHEWNNFIEEIFHPWHMKYLQHKELSVFKFYADIGQLNYLEPTVKQLISTNIGIPITNIRLFLSKFSSFNTLHNRGRPQIRSKTDPSNIYPDYFLPMVHSNEWCFSNDQHGNYLAYIYVRDHNVYNTEILAKLSYQIFRSRNVEVCIYTFPERKNTEDIILDTYVGALVIKLPGMSKIVPL